MANWLNLLLVLTNFLVNLQQLNAAISDPALLFANRQDIRLVDIERPWVNGTSLHPKNIKDAAAVDFNFGEREVCWIDIFLEEIKCASLSSSARSRPRVITERLINPDGLAIDWITGKLYWTDSDTKRIEVANRSGGNRRVLFYDQLDRPRAIVLLPSEGLLFWTDWGEVPKIERAGMDGDLSTRSVFVSDDIYWPNGITIDYDTKMVYWTEANKDRSQISAQRYDGTGRRLVIENVPELKHPFSVTLYRDRLYWTDWSTRSIHSCKKQNGTDVRTVLGGENGLQPLDLHVFSASRQPGWPGPGASPCQRNNGGCSHLCLLSPGAEFRPRGSAAGRARPGRSCSCPTGVRLVNDTHCAGRPERLILLARRTDLRTISLDTPDHTDIMLPLRGVRHAVAVDYDPIEDEFYWTDEETKVIQRSRLDGSGQEQVIRSELHSPDGVAIDWIARNVYWTDTGSNRIEVARLDGAARKVLVSEDLDEPRAIAVDPVAGYMYWSDWSGERPKIERAALDGTLRRTLFDVDLKWPNGIALDLKLRTLYWCDAGMDRIETANMDGTGRRVLLNNKLPHLFGISLLDDFVYWTDWTSRTIERVHKMTGDERQVIVEHLPDLMGLKVVSRTAPIGTNGCWGHNGNCSHLCLNTPNGPTCHCPIGHELTSDLKTCIVPDAFLLYSQNNSIRRVSLETPQGDVVIPLSNIKEAGFLALNVQDERIYWADTKDGSISRAFTNGSSLQKVIQLGTDYAEGLAVDWLAGNIYWSEAMTGRIEVARLDGASRRVLFWDVSRDPRSIAVDANSGYLFWADWSTAMLGLYRSRLDCTESEQFVKTVNRCMGLTVDHASGRLFWVDVDSKRIESALVASKDGHRVVLEGLMNPYGLAVFRDFVYWVDWGDGNIQRADKMTGANRTVVLEDVTYVVDLLVFHRSRKATWTPCVDHNGGCQSLCFARPLTADGQRPAHRCGCRSHYRLAGDERACLPPVNFLLFAQRSRLHRYLTRPGEAPDITLPITDLSSPRTLSFDPRNQHLYWADAKTQTIRRARDDNTAQDTVVRSSSGSRHRPFDIQVEPYSGVLFWSCAEQNAINVTRLNGSQVGVVVGGADSEDRPRHLALMPEHGLMVWANLGQPARIELCRLDGSQRRHLVDRLEKPPSGLAADTETKLVYWADLLKIWVTDLEGNARVLVDRSQLKYHGVVRGLAVLGRHLYWIDPEQQLIRRVDKETGLDATTVVSRTDGLTAIVAVANLTRKMITSHPCYGNGLCSHLCVAVSGRPLCSCPLGMELGRDNRTCQRPPSCSAREFACPYGEPHCVPLGWRCDGKSECEGGADEHNCSACTGAQFACNNGQCIDHDLACDGVAQCDDRSDETACCDAEPQQFLCHHSHQCVPLRQLCDGVHHCPMGEDETLTVCAGGVSGVPADKLGGRAGRSQHSLRVILVVFPVTALAVFGFVLWWCRCRGGKAEPEPAAGGGPLAAAGGSSGARPRPVGASRRGARPRRESVPLSVLSRPAAPASSPVSSSPYDRAHVTGASSSSSGSAGTRYPLEPLNPPPSPATGLHSAGASTAAAGSSHAPTLGSYRYYKLRNRPPPPTPCSTDVCDSDSATYYAYRCGSVLDSDYESDTYGLAMPPPPPPPPPSVAANRSGGSRRKHRDRPGPPPPSPAAERYML